MHATEYALTNGVIGILIHAISSVLIRWCVALGPYSGENKPPLYGDYEAQRHWQEITFNLPIKEWYTNSTSNDLMYWGLDYPPLTAYHSWLCGYVASLIDPEWVQLYESRGIESYNHKLFMRYTVLVADLVVLFPALLLLWHMHNRRKSDVSYVLSSYLLLGLFYPGLILIDHGHFQYNNISLGLFIWSVIAFDKDMIIFGSIAFCLSLNYKQMELFHSLPIFFYLLGRAFNSTWMKGVWTVCKLGVTVIISFGIIWMPYLTSVESALQVVNRLFPVNRGLYEDKVANFWCSIAPVIKFKDIMDQQSILKLCAGTSILLALPSCLHLLKAPTSRNLKLSLVYISLIFFLFSYQVHEKSILIPAISACLLYDIVPPLVVTWFLHITVLSLSPLLFKDGLTMQQVAVSGIFMILCSLYHGLGKKSVLQFIKQLPFIKLKARNSFGNSILVIFWFSIVMSAFFVFLPYFYEPPKRFPDLIPVVISIFCCAAFLCFALVFFCFQLIPVSDIRAKKIK